MCLWWKKAPVNAEANTMVCSRQGNDLGNSRAPTSNDDERGGKGINLPNSGIKNRGASNNLGRLVSPTVTTISQAPRDIVWVDHTGFTRVGEEKISRPVKGEVQITWEGEKLIFTGRWVCGDLVEVQYIGGSDPHSLRRGGKKEKNDRM